MHVETAASGVATINVDNEKGKRDVILESAHWMAVDREGGVYPARAIDGPPAIAPGYSHQIIVEFPTPRGATLSEIRYTDPETLATFNTKINYYGE